MGLIDFFRKKKEFDKKLLKAYLDKNLGKSVWLDRIAIAAVHGGAEDVATIQKFYPEITRERARQIIAKIERIARHQK